VDEGACDLVVAVRVVVQHPPGEGDGRVEQRVADRLRAGGLLEEVAEAGRLEGADRLEGRTFLLGFRRQALDAGKRGPEQVQMDPD
jgi:hypothetical protein